MTTNPTPTYEGPRPDLVPVVHGDPQLVLAPLVEKAQGYARASKAPSTWRTYESVWRVYTAWCRTQGVPPLPSTPEVVVAYLVARSDEVRPQTLKKHLAVISKLHKLQGYETPIKSEMVKTTLAGIRRTVGVATSPKKALRVEHVRQAVAHLGSDTIGVRDRALVLVGFTTGMRRSEIAALQVADVEFEPEGAVLTIRRSKRDQDGRGRRVLAPYMSSSTTCPVRALRTWLETRGVESGALFVRLDPAAEGIQGMSGWAVAQTIKRVTKKSGLDPSVFSGHSLRRGFCTETARAGASEREIARSTGHRSMSVLRGYIEEGRLGEDCAARHLDL